MSDVVDTQRIGFTIIWQIENFSLASKLPKTDLIRSPSFIADNLAKTSWYLLFFPIGFSPENKDTFLFRLHKNSGKGPDWIFLDYELSILYKTNSKEKSVTITKFCFQASNTYRTPVFIAPHDIFNKREILQGDTLTVQCKMWNQKISCLEPGFSLARTQIGTQRKSFSWKIDKFSTLQVGDTKSLIVELFHQQNLLHLVITLFLTGGPDSEEKVQIKIKGRNKEQISSLMFGISVQNADGESMQYFQNEFILGKESNEWWSPLILEKKHLVEDKNLLLPGDVLSLKCILEVYDIISNRIELSAFGDSSAFDLETALTDTNSLLRLGKRKRHSNSNSLKNEMRYLFHGKQHADVSLRVQNEIFPVHKAILAARSSVFKAMFDTDMKEKSTNTIEIDDIKPDTMRHLLLYIYSDSMESNIEWENAYNLCFAADKYAVLTLKEKCCSYLMAHISLVNVCDIFVLADMMGDEDLKEFVVNFMQDKDQVILNSDEWKHFALEHQSLTIDVLTRLYKKCKGSLMNLQER